MYKNLVVALNQSPESERALATAIQLARTFGAELHTVTVMDELSALAVFAVAGGAPSQLLKDDQLNVYEALTGKARVAASLHGLDLHSHRIEGREVTAIIHFLHQQQADLLVLGLHQRDFYISRLWSTVYELAQEAPCSVLGVH